MSDFVQDRIKRLAPDMTETQLAAAADRARAKALANGGGGIVQLLTDADRAGGGTFADTIMKEAIAETMVKAKLKGETDLAGPELAKLESQRLCFGKAGAASPLKHRGEYVRKYGVADFDAAMKTWGASATNLATHSNPYTKSVKKQMREARNGTLENTEHNRMFAADQIKAPPKVKRPKVEGGPMTMTALSKLYLADPEAARAIAARSGLKI